ncbi:MAG: hypothetical protein LBF87_00590 [Treponema sp.]|jgi:NitT/TauT family transport system permease protein|nr:hypothetical protein [Treponema sp.]
MSELSISAAPKGLSVDKDLTLSIHFDWRTLIPLASVAFTQVLRYTALPVASAYRTKVSPWFIWFNIAAGVLVILAVRERFTYKSWFLGVAFFLLNLYNLITVKFGLIPIQQRADWSAVI